MNKTELLISRLITPKATVGSLEMGLSALVKSDADGARLFIRRLCEADLLKAAALAHRVGGIALEETAQYLNGRAQCGGAEIAFAAAALECESIFAGITLDESLLRKAFALCSDCFSLLKMAEYSLKYADDAALCDRLFSEHFNYYDSSCDSVFLPLLEAVIENRLEASFAKIMLVVGADKLCALSNGFWSEACAFCADGAALYSVWAAYIDRFLAQNPAEEAVFEDGLWFIQSSIEDDALCNEVLAYFYISLLEKGGADEILKYIDIEHRISSFSREYLAKYGRIAASLQGDKAALIGFLRRTEKINPYLVKDKAADAQNLLERSSLEHLRLLAGYFDECLPEEDIAFLFFNTDLFKKVAIEELFAAAPSFESRERLIAALKNRTFNGKIVKYKDRLSIISPYDYCIYTLHEAMDIDLARSAHTEDGSYKGAFISYKIRSVFGSRLVLEILPRNQLTASLLQQKWAEAVECAEKAACSGADSRILQKIGTLSDFSAEKFISELDLTDLICLLGRCETADAAFKIVSAMKWNGLFCGKLDIPTAYFSAFEKYKEPSRELFKKLIAVGNCESAAKLYFNSVFKAVLPLNTFLALCSKSEIMPVLQKTRISCKTFSDAGSAWLCRPWNITCAPICVLEKGSFNPSAKIFAYIHDYETLGGTVTKIIFREYIAAEDGGFGRIDTLYKYVGHNFALNSYRIAQIGAFPDIHEYFWHSPAHYLNSISRAVILRQNEIASTVKLLQVFGEKNPFAWSLLEDCVSLFYLAMLRLVPADRVEKTMTDIILNSPSIRDIFFIYFNSFLKYHVSIHKLLSELKLRRRDFEARDSILRDNKALCLADANGDIWFPFIKEGACHTDEYRSCALLCDFDTDGNIKLWPADRSGAICAAACVAMGYENTDALLPYLETVKIPNLQQGEPVFEHFYGKFFPPVPYVHEADGGWREIEAALDRELYESWGNGTSPAFKAMMNFFENTSYYKSYPVSYIAKRLELVMQSSAVADSKKKSLCLDLHYALHYKLTHSELILLDRALFLLGGKFLPKEHLQKMRDRLNEFISPYN